MPKRLTTEQFIEKAKTIHGDRYDYSLVEYKNARTKVKIICPMHGVFEQVPKQHLKGRSCFKCGHEQSTESQRKRKTTEEFIIDAWCVHGDRYNYKLVEYKNNKTKVKIICPNHGVFEQRPYHHIDRKQGCPECRYIKSGKSNALTTEEFIEKAKSVHGDRYNYKLVEYKNNKTKVKIICKEHGAFDIIPSNHISKRQKQGCPECSKLNYRKIRSFSKRQFIQRVGNIHNCKYDYSMVEYHTNDIKIKIICPIHGVFEQRPLNHLNLKQGCPKCASHISKSELELQEWLKRYIDIETNNSSLISPLELDIVIPSHKLAIEYNGLYWHGEQQGKDRTYHLNKYLVCKEQGYRLIQIWENEWLLKQDIVKSILINALGKTPNKIHGRKCIIVNIRPKEAKLFYNNNHIQGFKGGRHIGLRYEDELVSLMTIDARGELQRFVNKKYHNVYGAFSKLLKTFIKEGYDNIYTFADLRYFTGNVYEKNGFKYVYTTKPNYYYFDRQLNVYHRRYFQKKNIERLFNNGKLIHYNKDETEYINMIANGYDRIWDCGNMKFIME